MESKRIFLILIITIMTVSCVSNTGTSLGSPENAEPRLASYSPPQLLTRFPVNLDLLYYDYDSRADICITPYLIHKYNYHSEGNFKFYLRSLGNPMRFGVYAPADANITLFETRDGNTPANAPTYEMNGTTVYHNCKLELQVAEGIIVRFDHMTVLKSIIDEMGTSPQVTAGTHLGFVPHENDPVEAAAYLDFILRDLSIENNPWEWRCPLDYFSDSVKTDVQTYYTNNDYARMKAWGTYPESNLCADPSVHIPQTIWGIWADPQTKDGDLNHYLSNINRERFINDDTFTKLGDGSPIMSNITGIVVQSKGEIDSTIGSVCIDPVSGDSSVGILQAYPHETATFKPFIRFELKNGIDEQYGEDDILTVEAFNTLAEAQAGFTGNQIEYHRFLSSSWNNGDDEDTEDNNDNDNEDNNDIGITGVFPLATAISLLGLVFLVRKRIQIVSR